MTDRAPRSCPQSDAETVEALCPADGSTTLMRNPLNFDLDRDAKVGLVVANRYRLAKELARDGSGAVPAVDPATGKAGAPRQAQPKKGGNALHREL